MSPKATKVKVGDRSIDERGLLREVAHVQKEIEAWATQNELWHDSSFAVPFAFHDEAPRSHDTILLITEGPMARIFAMDGAYGDYEPSFTKMLEKLGYWFELENHYTFSLYPTDDRLREDFLSLHRWQWLQKLSEKKLVELHAEAFEHFAQHPDSMKKLGWRQFEELLDAIFKNQGFHTELGPGTDDGGVDIRLYQDRAIPEVVTIVQAKRYTDNPIQLEPVAALYGIAGVQDAAHAIFATTSYFQPAAREFALSTERKLGWPTLELADGAKVAGWCSDVAVQLKDYFENGLSVPRAVTEPTGPLVGWIVVAQGGYNCTSNFFAKIEADFPHEVILRPIGDVVVSGDMTAGSETPSESARVTWTKEARLLASKTDSGRFKADRKLFSIWDGTPQYFNSD